MNRDSSQFWMGLLVLIFVMLLGAWTMEGVYRLVYERPLGPLVILFYILAQFQNPSGQPPQSPPRPFGDEDDPS